jgi:hypothetical protein
MILPTWMRSCPSCGAGVVGSDGGQGPLYVADAGDWSCSACSTWGVSEDFLEVLAGRFWDVETAPTMRASGTPEDVLASLRHNYVRDVVRNLAAVRQLREWADAQEAEVGS